MLTLVHSFLLNIAGIFIYWLFLAATFAGTGLLLTRMMGSRPVNADRILASFWIGFVVVIAFLQLWHLEFAVDWRSLLLIACLGVIGIFANFSSIKNWVSDFRWRERRIVLVVLVLAGLWISDWAAGHCTNFDTGMYHIPVVRWVSTYPIIPGLGNLHDRLGFNTPGLLYAAMIGVGPWAARSPHLANGLLVFALMAQAILGGSRLIASPRTRISPAVFDLLLAVPAVIVVITGNVSSLSTDVPPALVLLVAGSALYKWLTASERSPDVDAENLLVMAPLLCLAVCLKVTAGVFSAIGLIITAWLARNGQSSVMKRRALLCAGALSTILVTTWVFRGVILSGYPLYPNRFAGLPVEWRIPAELAEAQTAWVTAFARHSVASGLAWVRPWLAIMLHGQDVFLFVFWVLVPACLALAAGLLYIIISRRSPESTSALRGWLLALPLVPGIAFWFWRIPDPRFGFYLFWTAAALAVAQLASVLPSGLQARSRHAWLFGCVLLASVAIVLERPLGWLDQPGGPIKALAHSAFVLPPRQGGLYPIPTAPLYQYTTDSGLKLYVPANDNRCWDAPLPCTPHPAPNLSMKTRWRRPEFVTDGDWQQINWPNAQSDFQRWFRSHHSHQDSAH